jgi:hypothetical protein
MNSSFVYRNISLLYRSLEEIQKNIGFVSRRGNAFLDNRRANTSDRVYTINADQRFMIETYKEMYNTILQHIEFLYSQLLHAPQQHNPNYQNQNPSNLFYFNGHYYTIDQTAPVNINTANPVDPHTHAPAPASTHRSGGSAIPPPPNRYGPIHRPVRAPRTFPRAIISRAMGNFNDPVNVVATPRQISTATTHRLYENIQTPTNDRCPICLEVFQPNSEVTQINNCRHIFNRAELATWFETNVRCPVCRFDIRDHVDTPPLPVTSSTSTEPINNTPFAQAPIADPNSDAASMSTLNNQLTSIMDTLTNQALQNMFDDNETSQILANLFNNNIENLTFDPSANAFTFDTFIHDRR